MRGFQLWVNLPSKNKMSPPGYQDITRPMIPVLEEEDGIRVHVVAGRYKKAVGPAQSQTPIRLLRVEMAPDAAFKIEKPAGQNAFFCIYEGSVIGADNLDREVTANAPSLAVLRGDDAITVTAGGSGAALFYGEGQPIGEPVARYGPFVMNTRDELIKAVEDFQQGRFVA